RTLERGLLLHAQRGRTVRMAHPAAEAEQVAVVDLVEHPPAGRAGELRGLAGRGRDVLRTIVERDVRLALEELVGRAPRLGHLLPGQADEELGDSGELQAMIDVR